MCVIPHHLSSAPHPHGDEEQLFIQIAPSIFSGIICPSDIPHCLFSPIFHQSDKKCYSSSSSGSEDERYVASSKGEITRHHFVVSYSSTTLQVYCPAFSYPLMVTIIFVIFASQAQLIIIIIIAEIFAFCWFLRGDFPSRLLMVSVVPQ